MMLLLTVAAAALVCAQGAVLPPVPQLDGRIVGGESASISEAPYQVALLLDYYGTGSFVQVCGGSIVGRSTVLTAAHCTDGTRASQWKVRAGSSQHASGGQVAGVTRIVQHPRFDDRLDNDVALLQLQTSLVLGSLVATATLPVQGAPVQDGASALATGWGTLSEGGISPSGLYKVTIPVVNQQQCAAAYASFNPVTGNMLCAGRLGLGGRDACQGDSGGPLVVGGVLVGVTSWGRSCAHPSYPGVWARVAVFRNWIDANM